MMSGEQCRCEWRVQTEHPDFSGDGRPITRLVRDMRPCPIHPDDEIPDSGEETPDA